MQSERILRELGELWQNLAQPEHGAATASGVLRACAMTLIVAAEDAADAQAAGETLAELMHEHPSRAIVLKPSQAGELDARVFAQCWMPFGGRQQICCEQIEIAAAPERMGDVPALMFGLLAPDLPVVLWCRGERWFSQPRFDQLWPLVGKLIIDSSHFGSAQAAVDLIADLKGRVRRVADLTWARLTGWREVIAQVFETPAMLAEAGEITEIRVGYTGETPSVTAYYLAAWLKRALPSAAIAFDPVPGAGDCVRTVVLGSITFRGAEGCTVEVRTAGKTHTTVLPPRSDYAAMREELSITRADTLFYEVHEIARGLIRGH